MASEAERLLAGSGWLPEPLRTPELAENAESPIAADEADALPEFLAGDGEQAGNEERGQEDDASHLLAAE